MLPASRWYAPVCYPSPPTSHRGARHATARSVFVLAATAVVVLVVVPVIVVVTVIVIVAVIVLTIGPMVVIAARAVLVAMRSDLGPNLLHVQRSRLRDEFLELRRPQRPGFTEQQDAVAKQHQGRNRLDLDSTREL